MRKLKLQVQMTLDGFIAGPNGEMDFMQFNWGEDINQYVTELTSSVDCIVLGRKLAQGFIPHWAGVAADSENPEQSSGKMFTDTPKVVFTSTLETVDWPNTTLAKGELIDEINQLKKQAGEDIIVYGGATFVSSLIKHNLIDEYHLFINPAAIGNGMPIFAELTDNLQLKLASATAFDCGIVALKYGKL